MSELNTQEEWHLTGLLTLLWERKWTLFASIVFFVLLALTYLWTTQPTYRSAAYFLPPEFAQVDRLNQLDRLLERNIKTSTYTTSEKLPIYNIDYVYAKFQQNLQSRELLKNLFIKHKLYLLYNISLQNTNQPSREALMEQAFQEFLLAFKVVKNKNDPSSRSISATLTLPLPPQDVQSLLLEHLKKVRQYTLNALIENEQTSKKLELKQINRQIHALRTISNKQKNDQIAKIDEAYTIAQSLKIETPIIKMASSNINYNGIDLFALEGMPLYTLGTKTLKLMKESLIARNSNDPFIKGLRGLQSLQTAIGEIKTEPSDISAFRVDQQPSYGEKTWPLNKLVLVLAIILGGLFGAFWILVSNLLRSNK